MRLNANRAVFKGLAFQGSQRNHHAGSRLAVSIVLALGCLSTIASAADVSAMRAPLSSDLASSSRPIFSELRFGVFAHDPGGPEEGSVDVNGEVLFAKPFRGSTPFTDVLIPRFHLGGSLNTDSKTNTGYAGFTWTYDITQKIFVDASFGGSVNDGKHGPNIPADRDALGCNWAFRESANVGYRFTQNWSLLAGVEHNSNAGLCHQNRGLTNVGAKVGYTF